MKIIDLLSRVAVGIVSGLVAGSLYKDSQVIATIVLVVLMLVGNLIVSMIIPQPDYD